VKHLYINADKFTLRTHKVYFSRRKKYNLEIYFIWERERERRKKDVYRDRERERERERKREKDKRSFAEEMRPPPIEIHT